MLQRTNFLEFLIPIVLILAGLGFILLEVYLVPGFNIVGVLGLLLMAFGVGYTYFESGMLAGSLFSVGAMGLVTITFMWLWRSGAWDRFILATSLKKDETLIARESEDRARFLGHIGTAVTPLRPTGIVEIDGNRIEVMTEGEFIAAGSDVRVVAINRRRYFVRLASKSDSETSSSEAVPS